MKNPELLKLVDMDRAKEFAEMFKALALEYDFKRGTYPENEYEGFSFLEWFVEKYIKEPLGFGIKEWCEELLAIVAARKAEKRVK